MTTLKVRYRPAPVPAKIANAVLFNVSWFSIIMTQSAIIAPVILLLHLLVHVRLMGKGSAELRLIAGVTVCGALIDQVLFRTGVFNVAGQPALPPLWLTCLWPVFATTLLHAFEGLQRTPVLAVLVGGIGGALSYVAGVHLSAVEFGSPLWGPVIIAVLWTVVFPALLKVSAHLSVKVDTSQAWESGTRRALD
jgi:hypothetical protein